MKIHTDAAKRAEEAREEAFLNPTRNTLNALMDAARAATQPDPEAKRKAHEAVDECRCNGCTSCCNDNHSEIAEAHAAIDAIGVPAQPTSAEVEEAHSKLKDAIRDFGCRSQDAGKHSHKRAVALGLADNLAMLARRTVAMEPPTKDIEEAKREIHSHCHVLPGQYQAFLRACDRLASLDSKGKVPGEEELGRWIALEWPITSSIAFTRALLAKYDVIEKP